MSDAPRPGWYRDPAGSHDFRWWDGRSWTDAISATADAPRPDTAQRATSTSVRGRAARSTPSPLKVLLVLSCGFALFAAVGLGVGLFVWRDRAPTSPPSGSQLSSPAPGAQTGPGAPTGQLDESSGLATIGAASMTLPGDPYELDSDPVSVAGVFDTVFSADADVHPGYDGKHSWSAAVMLAHLSPTLTSAQDLDQSAATTVSQLSRHMFNGHPTTVRRLTTSDHSMDGHPAMLVTLEVHYAIPALPSRYDDVTVLMVRLDDGSVVAAISSVPNDANATVTQLARQSVRSLNLR